MTRKLQSAYTHDQWAQLEEDVFSGAGEALTRIRDHARGRILAPVPFLLLCAQRALTSLPGHANFNAGLGPGSLNTFIMLVGRPGEAKDLTVSAASQALTISHNGQEMTQTRDFALGSGEGVVALLKPERDDNDHDVLADPVVFGASEIGQVAALMNRTGSTLRSILLSIYSGNPLGFSNKNDRHYVPANKYSAGVWIGCQPDKAGAVLDGPDDGLKHRFIWSEMFDPLTGVTVDGMTNGGPELLTVDVPEGIMRGLPFTYAPEIVRQTRQNSLNRVKFGMTDNAQGHRHQTQLKLAAGLALLASRGRVDLDDWRRAGALMAYSDAVIHRCQSHLDAEKVREEAGRLQRREDAQDSLLEGRREKARSLILDALAQSDEPVSWTPLHRRAKRFREEFVNVAEELEAEQVISIEQETLDNGMIRRWISPGIRYSTLRAA